MDNKTLYLLRLRTAELAIGPSALRNQGDRNVVRDAREYLKGIDLQHLRPRSESEFRDRLDRETEQCRRALPRNAKHWGTARKALNLYLRDVLYNQYLCSAFGFQRLEPWLELPLDSYVAKGICECVNDAELPKWPGVKHLDKDTNEIYQDAAARIGADFSVARVHMDIHWWRKDKL